MTDLERALAAGGQVHKTDLEQAMEAGGVADETPDEQAAREAFLRPGGKKPTRDFRAANEAFREGTEDLRATRLPSGAELAIGGVGNMGNSLINTVTAGGYKAALHAGGRLPVVGDALERAAQGIDAYREEVPIASQFTDAPGYFYGAPAMLSKAIGAGFGYVDKVVPEAVSRALSSRPVAATLTGGLNAGGLAAAETASEGADAGEVLTAAGKSALIGSVLGGGAGLAAEGLARGGRAIENSRGGQARKFIESKGGTVSARGVALPGEYVTKGTTDADIGRQAEASAAKGLDMLNREKKGVLRAVGNSIERAGQSPEAGELHDVTDMVTKMRDAVDDLATDSATAARLREDIARITQKQGADFNPDVDGYFLTATDVNKLKRTLQRSGKSGISTDEKLGPLQGAAADAKAIVDSGPFAEPNAQYAAESRRYQQSRRMLGIAERPKTPEESRTAVDTVKNRIMRRGQNTVTAGGQRGGMEEFDARHPDIAAEFDKPELLRRRADLSFHAIPQHGGIIPRIASGAALHSLPALAGGMMHSPGLAAATAAGTLLLQNTAPIAGRLLYPAAVAAQRLTPPRLIARGLGYSAARREAEGR